MAEPTAPLASSICLNGLCALCHLDRCEHHCHEDADIIAFPGAPI